MKTTATGASKRTAVEREEAVGVNAQRELLRTECGALVTDLENLLRRRFPERVARITELAEGLKGKLPLFTVERMARGKTYEAAVDAWEVLGDFSVVKLGPLLSGTRDCFLKLSQGLGQPWTAPPAESVTVIPLASWQPGTPSRRAPRWREWKLWPREADRATWSSPAAGGRLEVRTHDDAGGFYAELVAASDKRLLRFVYPRPMPPGHSMSTDYDWSRADLDRELTRLTAERAVRFLRVIRP